MKLHDHALYNFVLLVRAPRCCAGDAVDLVLYRPRSNNQVTGMLAQIQAMCDQHGEF
jgi:hypothetical protein